jgi:hypothetical protein
MVVDGQAIDQLDATERRRLGVQREVEFFRLKIAIENCPIKADDRIKIECGGELYVGLVERVDFSIAFDKAPDPILGAPPVWCVRGQRIADGDDVLIARLFTFTNFNANFEIDRWVIATS